MIAAVFFAAAAVATPADAGQEFVLIAEAHRAIERYDLMIEVTFPEGSPIPPVVAGVQRMDPSHELRTFGDLTILETPEWRVAVDAGDRVIVVGRRDGKDQPVAAAPPPTPAEALATWTSSGNMILGGDVVPEGRRWQIVPAGGIGTRAEIVVDPRTRLLRRLEYESRDRSSGVPVRVAIRYTWRDATHLRPEDFDVSRFIAVKGGDVRPSENYAGFRILRSDASR